MHSGIGRFGMLKKQKFQEQHFVPKLLDSREICLSPAGSKIIESIAKHMYV